MWKKNYKTIILALLMIAALHCLPEAAVGAIKRVLEVLVVIQLSVEVIDANT